MSTMRNDPRLITDDAQASAISRLRGWISRTDLGPIPVLIGLGVIWLAFQLANHLFLSPLNLSNLVLQVAATGVISVGIVLVLLLGEIDLSVGSISGLAGAIMAILNVKLGIPGPIAILAGLAAGAGIGLFQGFWITKLRVPSFVVTLAGLLGWEGLQLQVLGSTGTVNLRDPFILSLTGTFYPHIVGWIAGIIFVLAVLLSQIVERQRRIARGLVASPIQVLIIRILAIGIGVIGTITVFNANRGLPLVVVILVGLVFIFDQMVRRTKFGRHIFAVGGNAEAARRASIQVDGIRMAVFTLASVMAACGGILAGSRLLAVNQSSGSGDILLNAIAGAVIGGTSLFGGRGSIWAALIGALVIGSISNGMDLLALGSPVKFMITGSVLLAAVTIDALVRRQREATGR
jgi:D-xylose transport system permease protein